MKCVFVKFVTRNLGWVCVVPLGGVRSLQPQCVCVYVSVHFSSLCQLTWGLSKGRMQHVSPPSRSLCGRQPGYRVDKEPGSLPE